MKRNPNQIHVRRAGLVSLIVQFSSGVTGLAFILIVTLNISQTEFGLWQLISRTLSYVLFPALITPFWITRYRARGMRVGRTGLLGALIFSAILSLVYLVASIPIAITVPQVSSGEPNSFYFFISAPQILLYNFSYVLEALLLATSPEKNSAGFEIFELTKVVLGLLLIALLKLSFVGVIYAVIGAQIIQIGSLFFFTKGEYASSASLETFWNIVKAGWLALLNNLRWFIINFDFLLIAAFTNSAIPLALYGAAFALATVVGYSGSVAYGLYPSILSGQDPKNTTNQILDLELFILLPIALGAVILRTQLLSLLGPGYPQAAPVLIVLVFWAAFSSFQTTIHNVISGTDKTDAQGNATFHDYLTSKLFLLSKIDAIGAIAYLGSIAAIGVVLGQRGNLDIFGIPGYLFVAVVWAVASVGRSSAELIVKLFYARKIAKVSFSEGMTVSVALSSALFSLVLYFLLQFTSEPSGGVIIHVLYLVALGVISLGGYVSMMYILQKPIRNVARGVMDAVFH